MACSLRTSAWPVWHPFTQHAVELPPRKIVRAEGAAGRDTAREAGGYVTDEMASGLHG